MIKIGIIIIFLVLIGSTHLLSQASGDSLPITVYAKKWSKVNGESVYSDWSRFEAVTTDRLPGFEPLTEPEFNKYGSSTKIKKHASGFFYPLKINNRWWIIDPEGYINLSVTVNGVRQGTSERNKKEFRQKYGNIEKWISETHDSLITLGFNGTGCWSEIASIQMSNSVSDKPLIYNMIWNFYSSYKRDVKNNKQRYFPVFDREFEEFVDKKAQELIPTKNDPNLLGHFSDNELDFKQNTLDEYLTINNKNDLNYKEATSFLKKHRLRKKQINDSVRNIFLGIVAERYFSVVSSSIKKYDPNHLYLGSRLHGRTKNNQNIFKAAAKYSDIISINYYGFWEPSDSHFQQWSGWADRPIIITEFYTKGMDSGMENNSGAGWIVKTQEERGIHYENFCIKLLKQKNCVGWHWFRYMDNDPTDKAADPSNNDSNKGIVDNSYNFYIPLIKHMKILNKNRYNLINYHDKAK